MIVGQDKRNRTNEREGGIHRIIRASKQGNYQNLRAILLYLSFVGPFVIFELYFSSHSSQYYHARQL